MTDLASGSPSRTELEALSKSELIEIMLRGQGGATPGKAMATSGLTALTTATPTSKTISSGGSITPKLLSCEDAVLEELVGNGTGMEELVDLQNKMGHLTATLAERSIAEAAILSARVDLSLLALHLWL